jgi:TrmH family RNA methyltransferase
LEIKKITSTENLHFKFLKSLTESRGLKKENFFLVSGKKLVIEFLSQYQDDVEALVFTQKIWNESTSELNPFNVIQLVNGPKKHCFELSSELFEKIDTLGTSEIMLVVKQKEIKEWTWNNKPNGLEILCPLSDPQNLGSLARSAWALGADSLILLKETAHPFLPKTWKSSAGTIWNIPLYQGPSVHDLDCTLFALDMNGENLNQMKWPKNARLLLGEEGQGLPEKIKAHKFSIPMRLGVESLNVAVAGAIAISHYSGFHHLQLQDTDQIK